MVCGLNGGRESVPKNQPCHPTWSTWSTCSFRLAQALEGWTSAFPISTHGRTAKIMHQMVGDPPILPARLCQLCRNVSFEDGKYGIDKMWTPRGESGKELPLDTVRKDELPHLPVLRITAENGCDFCNFLRAALLRRQLSQTRKQIQIRMSFTWGMEMDYISMYGLANLTVTLNSEDNSVHDQIIFDISSYDGKPFLSVPARVASLAGTLFKDMQRPSGTGSRLEVAPRPALSAMRISSCSGVKSNAVSRHATLSKKECLSQQD